MGLFIIGCDGQIITHNDFMDIDRLISIERLKELRKEELPIRKTEPFYPDFDNDVFAGVL